MGFWFMAMGLWLMVHCGSTKLQIILWPGKYILATGKRTKGAINDLLTCFLRQCAKMKDLAGGNYCCDFYRGKTKSNLT